GRRAWSIPAAVIRRSGRTGCHPLHERVDRTTQGGHAQPCQYVAGGGKRGLLSPAFPRGSYACCPAAVVRLWPEPAAFHLVCRSRRGAARLSGAARRREGDSAV